MFSRLLSPFSRRQPSPTRFELRYAPPGAVSVRVGLLTFESGRWTFAYEEEFKTQRDLHPIEGFDDLDKVYESETLFPFFLVRIPSIKRSDVRRALQEAHLENPELPDLLALFGRRVISSPAFELVPLTA